VIGRGSIQRVRIRDRLFGNQPCFSFEFFPPKTDEGTAALFRAIEDLRSLEPGFVSVTYGAGGSTRGRTVELARRIKDEIGVEVMVHLTCAGHTREELLELLGEVRDAGLENVLALRGDPPKGEADYRPTPGGLQHASELVALIRRDGPTFCVGGAGYPEGHLECASRDDDLQHLKEKVAAGLDFVITQFFFDNAFYFDFVERCRRAGIHVPIVPGIMPLTNYDQVERFTRQCGATIPRRLQLQAERHRDDPEAITQLGTAHATVQCMELLARGVPGIHFFTLNRSPATRMIVTALHSRGGAGR
jgi:methylenetetrahydrofolate reductase (NADPH)